MSKGIKLANGLTPQDERYAALLAQGSSQAGAYREVWPEAESMSLGQLYTVASRRACKVRARVEEIIAEAGRETVVSVVSLTREIDEDRALAYDEHNAGAAVQATKLKAQLHRHLTKVPSTEGLLGGIAGLIASLDRPGQAEDETPEDEAHEAKNGSDTPTP